MPIITEKYSNPKWGFLDGLGQTPTAVPLLLADPKTGKFSNERFEALKKVLIAAMGQAWADYNRTWAAVNRASSIWKSSTEREAAARLKDSLQRNTLPRLNQLQQGLEQTYKASSSIWASQAQYSAFLDQIQTEIRGFQADAEVLKFAADMGFYRALADRAKEVLKDIYDAGAGVVGPAVWLAKSLPWILGIGAVVLIAGPTIAGALKSGRSGAASAFESDVRSARGAIASGARRAFSGVSRRRRKARR